MSFFDELGQIAGDGAKNWLNQEIQNRLNPTQSAQPVSTTTIAENDQTKQMDFKKIAMIGGGVLAVILVLVFALKGGRRGRK